jgi:hypothetical protein
MSGIREQEANALLTACLPAFVGIKKKGDRWQCSVQKQVCVPSTQYYSF